MVSFWKVLESMEADAALLDGGEDSKAMRVVRTGAGLRSNKDCGSFWDDFISVCNDSEGLSELLDVPSEKIGNWTSKIKDMLDKMDSSDDQDSSEKKSKMLTTGATQIGSGESSADIDTRPMP